jgi:hypothetical protein
MSYKNLISYPVDKALLAFADGNQFGKSITVVGSNIPLNDEGKRLIPSGLFVAENADGTYRFLPRAKVTTAITTAMTSISVSPVEGFKVGDVLYTTYPSTTLTISAPAIGETQSLTIAGVTVTVTATTTVAADLAELLETAIKANMTLNSLVRVVRAAGVLRLEPLDGKTLYGVTEGGTATGALSAATMAYTATAIGTITAIDPTAKTLTLAAVAGVAVPVGATIGAEVKGIVGMSCGSMDFTQQNRINVAVLTKSGGVREHLLPYFEEGFRSLFPQVLFSDKI